MVTSTKSRLTGERPQQGVTPDSLLALHEAGYRAVLDRIGRGRILDVGCGQGFESARFLREDRQVVGVDYSSEAAATATARYGPEGLRVAQMNALDLGFLPASFDGACSSHLIEHFTDPEPHVAEMARVLKDDGVGCVLTPNKPADFENPFHLHLFEREELRSMLERHFGEVWLGGVDAAPHVKADLAARRVKANKVLKLDVFDLRHRMPHSWYVWSYTRLLPLAYKLIARDDSGGATGITADDWFVTDELDDTTLVLFAVVRAPRRATWADAGRRPHGRHRFGEVGRGRPPGRARRRAHRRRPGRPGRGGARRPRLPTPDRPLRARDPGRRRDHRPQGPGRLAFADDESRLALNAITHPAIGIAMIEARDALADSDDIVVLAIPLLTALHRETVKLHKVVVVDAPTDIALDRLLSQRGFDRADAEARIKAQISREERVKEADYVLDNSGDRAALEAEVATLWDWLREAAAEQPAHA